MLKLDVEKQLASVNGALALRNRIEAVADRICRDGFSNLFFTGVGGTYASGMQTVNYMTEFSSIPVYVENAAEWNYRPNRHFNRQSVLIFSSVTGTTAEVLDIVKKARRMNVRILGFVDEENSPLAQYADYCISYPGNEQLKFMMTAHRFMQNRQEAPFYDDFYGQMDASFAKALINAEEQADDFGLAFAKAHQNDALHYFIGAGSLWGTAYSYAMCYWEEMHWIRTKSIHAAEFFHGTLEIIEKDTPVTVFVGEDSGRPLSERAARFLPRICSNYTVIDTKDYRLEGIDPQYRPLLSPFIVHAVTQRIDAHLEKISCHPMEIRRYYRCLEY